MPKLNATHNPEARSWVETANDADCDFPIQNLPFGIFSTAGKKRVGTAIGNQILDLSVLEEAGLLRPSPSTTVFNKPQLNDFMALPQKVWSNTRHAIFDLLGIQNAKLRDNAGLCAKALIPMTSAVLHLPIFVRSFTDFYASKEHASNVGAMFRGPDNALMPNWLHLPVGYNARASTVVVSGTEINRPCGQLKGPNDENPRFAPCEKLDIELELGAIVGTPSQMGTSLTTAEAYDMIFGYVILNDWSARDIQTWEYQPLGPFQSKAFATTISPWVITREALEPFRTPTPTPIKPLLPYLQEHTPNNFNINMAVNLIPQDGPSTTLSATNYKNMYYSSAQQLTHHASSGCAMCTGDLLGSGTISGPTKDSYGSLLEMTWGGKETIQLTGGGTRSFIEDGDTLELTAHCITSGYRVGFGTCRGKILPAIIEPDR